MVHDRWAILALVAASFGVATAATAADPVCVACDDPAQTYECMLPDDLGSESGKTVLRGAAYLCIEHIARAGRHRACGVRRGEQGPCIGQRVSLADLLANSQAANPDGRTATGPGPAATATPAPPNQSPGDEPPQTMTELAKRAAAATQRQLDDTNRKLKDTSDSVGGFMSDTWRCVTSLFSKCGKTDQ